VLTAAATALPGPRLPSEWGQISWARTLFRTLITLAAALAFLQTVFAGAFLSGHYGALNMHETNATIANATTLLATIAAVLIWRVGKGAAWPAAVCAALFLAEAVEIFMGYARVLSIHVALGTSIVAAFVVLLLRVWRPASALVPDRRGYLADVE
jgi:hypothetical protein